MASNKSFTFKIGADTSDFIKEMNKADRAVNDFDKQAQKLEKGLHIEFDESRFVQSQKLMQQALELTEKQADACRAELKHLEETGQVDTKAYEDIQNKLAQTENKAVILKQRLNELNAVKFTQLGNDISKVGQGLTTLAGTMRTISVAAGAAVAGLTKVAKDTVKTGDEIATLATKYKLSATEIQRWQYIAMQSDVENTSLYRGILKLNSTIADMAQGNVSKATEALQALGLDANTSFEQLISSLSSLEDETLQAYYANELFGDRLAADLLPLLSQGADAINEYINEFEEVGYLSEDAVAALSEFDNVLNRVKTEFKQVALELGQAVLPVFKAVTEYIETKALPKLKSLVDRFDSMSDSAKELTAKILIMIPVITALTAGVGKLIIGIGNIIKSLPQIASLLSTLEAHPIIAIIGIIAMLLTILYTRNEKFRESMDRLLGILTKSAAPIFDRLSNVLSDIFEILGPIIDLVGNQLGESIQFICTVLEPLVEILSWIIEAANTVEDILLGFVGKGWLWGTEDGDVGVSAPPQAKSIVYEPSTVEYPTIKTPTTSSSEDTYNTDNSTVVNNITIEANEYTTAEEVAKVLSLKLQSRR